MLYILYSNDYEVFLGGNHLTEIEVLADTTKKLLSVCDDISVPMTLFCDVACLWRYRELGRTEFPIAIENQLKQAIRGGHDVQVHLHPHWLETKIEYSDNGMSRYRFDLNKFLLGNFAGEDKDSFYCFVRDLLDRSKAYLTDLLHPECPSYRCVAYRAGGYGIQPCTQEIFTALQDSGYLIDSSIVPGMVLESNVNRIDFSEVPRKGNYHISPKQGLKRAMTKGVFELPVLACDKVRWPLFKRTLRQTMNHLSRQERSRLSPGYPVQSVENRHKYLVVADKVLEILHRLWRGWYALELGDDVDAMIELTRVYIDRYDPQDADLYFSLSCHSKSTTSSNLDALRSYHRRLKLIYGDRLKAITFQQAADHLESR